MIEQEEIYHRWQIAVGGLAPSATFMHRGVNLRPLTPIERGVMAEPGLMGRRDQEVPRSDFEPPSSFTVALPSALLEITTKRLPAQSWDSSTLPNRVILALFLSGFEVSGTGVMPNFDLPRWVARVRVPRFRYRSGSCVAGQFPDGTVI